MLERILDRLLGSLLPWLALLLVALFLAQTCLCLCLAWRYYLQLLAMKLAVQRLLRMEAELEALQAERGHR